MKSALTIPFAAIFALLGLTCLAYPQSNTVAGRDVKLLNLSTISVLGRTGTFPNGVNGLAQSTTACNIGTVTIPWQQAMDPDHPFISFLVMRESNGRFEQISDRSYTKHGFFATNQPSGSCGTCQNPGTSSLLGIKCTDTYSTSNNGDRYWLGPTDEINPWLGTWDPICSYFDKGDPEVAPPQNCDGSRSLSMSMASALGPVAHRIEILDQDLGVAGANYYFQAQYTTQGEAESQRNDNLGSRKFTASWNGSAWVASVPSSGNAIVYGSVLQRWTGASVGSNTNGANDGRVYVAVLVTGPVGGLFHYEYAVHNRDNFRAVSSFRVPVCASAQILNPSSRDIDQDGSNDWSVSVGGGEIAFTTGNNPLLWNTVYNFSFDSDAGPAADNASLEQFLPGAGAPTVAVSTSAPLALDNVNLGAGCGTPAPPSLYAIGSPAKATLGNASFGLQCSGNAPGAQTTLLLGLNDATVSIPIGCNLYMDLGSLIFLNSPPADGSGITTTPLPIPNNPSFEGLHANFQSVEIQLGSGAALGDFDLSNGLRVRIGNSIPACP